LKEFVMEKVQRSKDEFVEWWDSEGRSHRKPRLQDSRAAKEQQMIRDLQSIFCKGRYRTWRPVKKRRPQKERCWSVIRE
jgi:hypothetical protein